MDVSVSFYFQCLNDEIVCVCFQNSSSFSILVGVMVVNDVIIIYVDDICRNQISFECYMYVEYLDLCNIWLLIENSV